MGIQTNGTTDVVLDIRDLEVVYDTPHGEVQAVSDVSLMCERAKHLLW